MIKTQIVIIGFVISLCLSSVLCNVNDTCSGTNVDTCTGSDVLYVCVDSLCQCGLNSYQQGVECLPYKDPLPVTDVNVADVTATSFKITWTKPSQFPGNMAYFIQIYKVNNNRSRLDSSEAITDFNTEEYNVYNKTSFYEYQASVQVIILNQHGNQSNPVYSDIFQTLPSAPGPVREFDIRKLYSNYTNVIVSWRCVTEKDRHGIITKYVLTVNSNKSNTEIVQLPTKDNVFFCKYEKIIDVVYDTNYTVTIRADSEPYNGVESVDSYYAPEGPPYLPGEYQSVVKREPVKVTTTSFTFSFCYKCLLDERNGKVIYTALIVCETLHCNHNLHKLNITSLKTYRTWKQAQPYGIEKPFIVTQDNWIDDLKSLASDSEWTQFIVGDEEGCDKKSEDTICNGPLLETTPYSVNLFTCTTAGCSYKLDRGWLRTTYSETELVLPIVFGVLGAFVGICVIVLFLLLLIRGKLPCQKKRNFGI